MKLVTQDMLQAANDAYAEQNGANANPAALAAAVEAMAPLIVERCAQVAERAQRKQVDDGMGFLMSSAARCRGR